MRLVDPHRVSGELAKRQRKARRRKLFPVFLTVAFVVGLFGFFMWTQKNNKVETDPVVQSTASEQVTPSEVAPKTIKTFTPTEFKELYSSFSYPYTQQIDSPPEITGDPEADTHIRSLAEARGYQLRSLPVADRLGDIGDDFQLQKLAVDPSNKLILASKDAGLPLSITSAFRSVDAQKLLFAGRLAEAGVGMANVDYIAAGLADASINEVLNTTAPPGYSRHHTGYTIDLQCGSAGLSAFEFSACNEWLARDNYLVAKQLGWIPSYPNGADLQGPEPESWEYIWVGVDALYE